MRVLLFGAGGFLGSSIERVLRFEPFELLAPSRQQLDLLDSSGLVQFLEGARPDLVVNAVGRVQGTAQVLTDANLRTVEALLDAMRLVCPRARLLHLGSGAEYGPSTQGSKITEQHETKPVTVYGQTKLDSSRLVIGSGFQALCLRVFNTLGPGCPATILPGAVARRLRVALREGHHELQTGPLMDFRSFVDVRDLARLVLMLIHKPVWPRVLNVGGLEAVSVRVVVEGLVSCSGFQGRLREDPSLASPRSAVVAWQQPDLSEVLALGWFPQHRLEASIADLWASMASWTGD